MWCRPKKFLDKISNYPPPKNCLHHSTLLRSWYFQCMQPAHNDERDLGGGAIVNASGFQLRCTLCETPHHRAWVQAPRRSTQPNLLEQVNEKDWIGPPTRCGSVVRHCGTGPDHLRLHKSPSRDTAPTRSETRGAPSQRFQMASTVNWQWAPAQWLR